MSLKAMPLLELTLTCQHCGEATRLEISFIQESRAFTCRHCGASSLIDKDEAAIELARTEQGQEHDTTGARE